MTGPIPDKPELLVEETEMVLKATAMTEDFANWAESVSTDVGVTSEQIAAWAAQNKRNATQ